MRPPTEEDSRLRLTETGSVLALRYRASQSESDFDRLHAYYGSYVRGLAFGMLGQDGGEDLEQDSWLQVLGNIGKWDDRKGEFRAWLRRLVLNCGRMSLRKTRGDEAGRSRLASNTGGGVEDGRETVSRELDRSAFYGMLCELSSDRARLAMCLRAQGYRNSEIGSYFGMTAGSVRIEHYRSMRSLRIRVRLGA